MNTPLPADLGDQELIHLTSGGNKEALGILYDRHASLIYSVLAQKLADFTEAQDIVHDVFLKLHLKSHLYNPTFGSPVAWLLTVARNTATDRLRRKSVHQKYIEKEMLDTEPSAPAHCGPHVDEIHLMRNCLATLPQKQQSILQMVYFSGLKQQEIADRLTEPLGSVKAWVRRGLLKLRDCMEGKR
ncbi:MAG: sigma-70 family RNA polymerase sigma factor [Luteolibacter sp.]